MRMLCPNLDREDSLDTVLEVPIPEEMFPSTKTRWQINMKYWKIKPTTTALLGVVNNTTSPPPPPQHNSFPFTDRSSQIQLLLGVIGAPLIPIPIPSSPSLSLTLPNQPRIPSPGNKDNSIESSMAKYIVQQYVAAMGGEHALNSIDSMYAMGKVKMSASEFSSGEGNVVAAGAANNNGSNGNSKVVKVKGMKHGGEIGGFVLWQKRPDLWCIELVVSGCKISAGSDGKVAWRQTPWHHSHASRGQPRPLRRSLQGLDPRLTASLFTNSVCIGEKSINGEECFILKLEAELTTLQARSSNNVEIIRHTIWGYFSQRTGLLIQLEDTHLLRIKPTANKKTSSDSSIFWETTMESSIGDYRTIDGVNIAHSGRTAVSLFRYGDEPAESVSRTRMEEVWEIEEVDFNIKGLEMDCFLPPSDIKKEDEDGFGEEGVDEIGGGDEKTVDEEEEERVVPVRSGVKVPMLKTVLPAPSVKSRPARISLAKIMAIDDDDHEL